MKHKIINLILSIILCWCGGKGGKKDAQNDLSEDEIEVEQVEEGETTLPCGPIKTDCGVGLCVDLMADPSHCGSCGNQCQSGQICIRGECKNPPCPLGLTECNGGCVDTASDAQNCGSCGNVCESNEVCAYGKCTSPPCPPGLSQCEDRCINILTDTDNCGTCGQACPYERVCSGGTCQDMCPTFTSNCGGDCVDLSSDPANCGDCFNICPAGENAIPTCAESSCGYECPPGFIDNGNGSCRPQCIDHEECNGVDDDCDGQIDEDFDCVQNHETTCTTTCGSEGTGVCTDECQKPGPPECEPPEEICNGMDDDCDTIADNGFECTTGETTECITPCGSTGTLTCRADCTLPAECPIPPESCNGLDDDCDTVADNGFECVQGQIVDCTTSCGTKGTGYCSSTCTPPTTDECAPPDEICNGVDDNCDGFIDEFLWSKTAETRITNFPGNDYKPTCIFDGENYEISFLSSGRTYEAEGLHLGGDPAVMWVKLTYTMEKSGDEIYIPQYIDETQLFASDSPKIVWASTRSGIIWKYTLNGIPYFGFATVTTDGSIGNIGSESFTLNPAYPDILWTGTEYFITYKDQEAGADIWKLRFGRRSPSMGSVLWDSEPLSNASGFMNKTPAAWTGSQIGVVWEDNRSGDFEIYFLLLTPEGTPAGSEVRVTNSSGDSFSPSIVYLTSTFGITWVDRRDGPSVVYFAAVDDTGTKVTDDVRIAEIGIIPSTQPHITSSNEEFAIVWKDPRSGNDEIYFQRITPDGNKIGGEIQVTNTAGSSANPYITFDGYNYLVVWDDDTSGNREIYAARLSCSSP